MAGRSALVARRTIVSSTTTLELEIPEERVVVPGGRELVLRTFLLHVARLGVERRNGSQEALEVERPGAQSRVGLAVRGDVLEMEAPVAVAVLREILHRVAATNEHVAHVQLQPNDGRIRALDEDVVRHLPVDRLHMLGFIVEREPDAGTT